VKPQWGGFHSLPPYIKEEEERRKRREKKKKKGKKFEIESKNEKREKEMGRRNCKGRGRKN
jgi:hypothetical protein